MIRAVAFLLVFILGFLACVGTIVGAGFYIYSSLSLDTVRGFGVEINTDEYIDPDAEVSLNAMTIQKFVEEIQYIASIGEEADLDMLIERYGLKLPEDVEKLIPDGLRDIPLAELFSANGINAVLEGTEVDYILALIPEGIISEQAREALSGKTLDLVVDMNLGYLLDGVKLGYVTGVVYETEEDGSYKVTYANPEQPTLLELLAPLDLGGILSSISGEGTDSIYEVVRLQLGDVMLESLATSLIGDFSQFPLPGMFGDSTVADIIVYDEETAAYSVDVFAILDNRTVGEILDYHYDANEDKWYFSEGGEPVDALFAAVCGVSCSELIDPGADPVTGEARTQIDVILDATGSLQLGHLMGYELGDSDGDGAEEWYKNSAAGYTYPSSSEKAFLDIKMEAILGDDPINDAFGGLYVGELMGYDRVSNPENPESNELVWVDEENNQIGALYAKIADYTVADLMDGGLSADDLMNDLTIADVLELESLDGIGVYLGEALVDDTKLEKALTVWVDDIGNTVNNMMNAIAGLSINGIEDEMNTLTLGDICGLVKYNDEWYSWSYDTDRERIVLEADKSLATDLAHITLGQFADNDFEDEIQKIEIGRFIGYTKREDGWYDGEKLVEGGIISAFTDLTLNDLSNDESVQEAVQTIKVSEVLGFEKNPETGKWEDQGQPLSGVMREIAECTVGELNDKINEMKVGEIAGYRYDKESGKWYVGETPVEGGILGALADLTIEEVTNEDKLSAKIQDVKVADVLGYTDNGDGTYKDGDEAVTGVLAVIAGSAVKDIQITLDESLMGDILGYEPLEDGLWSNGGVVVDGLMNAVANTKFSEIGNLYTNLTIADIVPADNTSGFLRLMDSSKKLNEIDEAIDEVLGLPIDEFLGTQENNYEDAIIIIDQETQAFLDDTLPNDENGEEAWRQKSLKEAVNYIIKELIVIIENLTTS